MGIIKRQSLKSSIVNYLGVFLGVVFFNFIFPHLIAEQYLGMIRLLQNLMYIFLALPILGFGYGLLRFYVTWKDENRVDSFNGLALLGTAIASVLFALAYYLFKEPIIKLFQKNSSLFIPYYYLVIPMVIVQAFIFYFEIYSMVKLRVAFPAFIREIFIRVLLIILVYLFSYKLLSEQQFLAGIPLVYFLSLVLLVFYMFRFQHFKLVSPKIYFKNNSDVKHQLLYGGGMVLVLLFSNIHNFIDGVLISSYIGIGAFGIYGIPLVLGQMIQVPYRSISLIALPIIREAFIENDMDKIKSLNKSISINLFLIGTFLFTMLVINADGIFMLLPDRFAIAKPVLYIIGIGRLLDMAFGLNSEILNSSKYYKHFLVLTVLLMLMTIALNIWLIPLYGMNGAALAVSISLTMYNVLKTWVLYAKFGFHNFSKHYITLSVLMIAVIAILYFIPYLNIIAHHTFINALANIALKSLLGLILFLIPLYKFNVSTDFNDLIKLIISGKIFKGGHRMEEL